MHVLGSVQHMQRLYRSRLLRMGGVGGSLRGMERGGCWAVACSTWEWSVMGGLVLEECVGEATMDLDRFSGADAAGEV